MSKIFKLVYTSPQATLCDSIPTPLAQRQPPTWSETDDAEGKPKYGTERLEALASHLSEEFSLNLECWVFGFRYVDALAMCADALVQGVTQYLPLHLLTSYHFRLHPPSVHGSLKTITLWIKVPMTDFHVCGASKLFLPRTVAKTHPKPLHLTTRHRKRRTHNGKMWRRVCMKQHVCIWWGVYRVCMCAFCFS